ncbi:RISC-loading complex subunit tarbp2-like isoform X2 [Thrips palmi]|nr:RISC-loading complex subunit tarbp2-like isoform X2 [Thrips palmi]XP_034233450.1 RISC-loading complex subunit tarbp2-like isoform X2 [Thrips palmi]
MTCNQTAVAILQELCMKRKWNPPLYENTDISGPSNDPMFEVSVTLCNGIKGVGRGRQKKAAKHDAAKKALEQLKEKALTDGSDRPVTTVQSKGPINPHEDASGLNAVGELQNLCMAKRFPAPEYTVIGDEGEPHEKRFTYKCTVSQRSATGVARKKQLAKHYSALEMLKILNSSMKTILDEIPNDPAVSSMYSQKNKEVPVSVLEKHKKTDTEVVERYKILRDNIAEIPSAPLISPGTKFADYHLKFASQLEGYKDIVAKPVIKTEPNPFKKLQMIAEELQFKICVTSEQGKDGRSIVFVQLETEPPTIQAGLHKDESAATQQAALNVLQFLDIMC